MARLTLAASESEGKNYRCFYADDTLAENQSRGELFRRRFMARVSVLYQNVYAVNAVNASYASKSRTMRLSTN